MKKKYLGLICLLYLLIILFVNRYNILRNFLAPNMQIYLKASTILLALIAIVIFMYDDLHYKFKIIDLVLLLPLIMLIFAGDGRLTTSFAANRISTVNNQSSKSVSDENEIEETEEEDNT